MFSGDIIEKFFVYMYQPIAPIAAKILFCLFLECYETENREAKKIAAESGK